MRPHQQKTSVDHNRQNPSQKQAQLPAMYKCEYNTKTTRKDSTN